MLSKLPVQCLNKCYKRYLTENIAGLNYIRASISELKNPTVIDLDVISFNETMKTD